MANRSANRIAETDRYRPSIRQVGQKKIRLGLPCLHCGHYYSTDLKACPVCKRTERIEPVVKAVSAEEQSHADQQQVRLTGPGPRLFPLRAEIMFFGPVFKTLYKT